MIHAYADAIVESVREGLAVLDEDLRVEFANAAFQRMFGLNGTTPTPRLMEIASGCLADPDFRTLLEALVREGMSIEDFEMAGGKAAGVSLTLLICGRVLDASPTGSPRFLLVVEDITHRRTIERDLDARSAELTRSNDDLEQFAAAASHDLREPLRKIQAFGSLLATRYGSSLDEEAAGYVDRMVESSARLQQLISDQLQYARIAVRTPEPGPTRLSDVAAEALSELELRIEDTGATVSLAELPVAAVDPDLFRYVFLNLIGNALKFARPGVCPEISIYSAPAPQPVNCGTIVVEDNGIGIEARHMDRIFRPFQRLHTRAEYEGSGMGLAIVRRIVERHGGSISLESSPGEGTRFRITLPTLLPTGFA